MIELNEAELEAVAGAGCAACPFVRSATPEYSVEELVAQMLNEDDMF